VRNVPYRNDIGVVSGMYGRQERCIEDFGGETCEKETTLKT